MSSESVEYIVTPATRSVVAIKFTDVTKTYRLYKSDQARLLSVFLPWIKAKVVTANNDLSFEIRRGESVALLGRNGAGKSTALKIITGVTIPDSGKVEVYGRVSALLDLSAGFDAQLTGRDNLRLRARLWGMTPSEIEEKMDEIVEFAELNQYIDQPLRTYSAGMKARLGFSFASSLDPDILILDEVMAVGDREFHAKSLKKMKEILAMRNITLLFVTHSLPSAKEFCQRGIVFDHGAVQYDGSINDAITFYEGMTK